MKKFIGSIVATAVLLLAGAAPGHAWGGHGGHHGFRGHHGGFGGHYGFGGHRGGFGHYGFGAFGYRYPDRHSYPYSSHSAPGEIRQPQASVQPPSSYWYYCESARAYHPYVQECPGGWRTIVPPATAPGQ